MSTHVLILGGARSGKTALGEKLAMRMGQSPAYLATAEVLDDEMQARVLSHRRQREEKFFTIEEPLELAESIEAASHTHDVILVDCLTLWISNLLGAEIDVTAAVDDLADALEVITETNVIMISNEVGLGIVPDNPLGRAYRDLAGWAHQRLAGVCDQVYFVAAGLPMALKGTVPKLD